MSAADESSFATMEISDTSSLLGEFEVVSDTAVGSDPQLAQGIDGISQEVATSRGPEQAHLELE